MMFEDFFLETRPTMQEFMKKVMDYFPIDQFPLLHEILNHPDLNIFWIGKSGLNQFRQFPTFLQLQTSMDPHTFSAIRIFMII